MSNKYKLEFTLKQHTPIIHFQSNQIGATLRATELKPKLDRFIKEKVFNGSVPNKFKISQDKDALDYKVKIKSDKENIIKSNELLKKSAFFGENNALQLNNIVITFISFNVNLLKKIENIIEKFFIYESFGMRNNKGFGNFTISTTTQESFESNLLNLYGLFYKKTNVPGNDDLNQLKVIKKDYQLLKSGENYSYKRNGNIRYVYHKSKLFEYCCQKNIKWEKRKLKLKLINSNNYNTLYPLYYDKQKEQDEEQFPDYADPINCKNSNTENENFRYIRVLLGLAEQFEYLLFKQDTEYRDNNRKLVISIKDTQEEVERFKSPIIFKVFENTIYLIPTIIPENIFNREFSFDLKLKTKNNGKWKTSIIEKNFMKIKSPEKSLLTNTLSHPVTLEKFLDKFLDKTYQKVSS